MYGAAHRVMLTSYPRCDRDGRPTRANFAAQQAACDLLRRCRPAGPVLPEPGLRAIHEDLSRIAVGIHAMLTMKKLGEHPSDRKPAASGRRSEPAHVPTTSDVTETFKL